MIEITNDNRKDLIASCLIEAANVLKDNTEVLEEAAIQTNISKLKYKIWVDPAGASRNKADTEPRVKIEVNRKLIPIYIPKSRGEKPYILVKNIEAQQKSKTGKIKGLDDVYDFILKYNDIFLMCYYLDSPIFTKGKNINNTDKIMLFLINTFIKNNRDKALKILSDTYNIPINDIIPDKYKDLRDNF